MAKTLRSHQGKSDPNRCTKRSSHHRRGDSPWSPSPNAELPVASPTPFPIIFSRVCGKAGTGTCPYAVYASDTFTNPHDLDGWFSGRQNTGRSERYNPVSSTDHIL